MTSQEESRQQATRLLVGVFEHHLARGGVKIQVRAGADNVELPAHLIADGCVLEYELDAVVPIPDLEVTEAGIRATLSFQRTPHKTFIPWSEVVAIAPMRPPMPDEKPRPKFKAV
jgi:hypothetical protein